VKRKGIGAGRTMKTAPVERKEGGYKASVTLKGVLRHALPIFFCSDLPIFLLYQEGTFLGIEDKATDKRRQAFLQ
jgi:hypothetical protein